MIAEALIALVGCFANSLTAAQAACGQNGTLTIASLSDLDLLSSCTTYAGDIYISGESLISVSLPPGLQTITGSLGVDLTPSMVTFEAPGLSSIGTMLDGTAPNDLIGILQLWVLPSLTTISFPNLTILGSQFQLANCSSLEAINGFPRLSRIGGSLNLLGNFSSISFPSLEYVGGNVMIVSSDPAFNCPLQGLESAGGIKGRVVCGASGNTSATSTAPLPNVTAVNPSATDLNSPTDHSSRSVASRGINIVSLVMVVFYALLTYVWWVLLLADGGGSRAATP